MYQPKKHEVDIDSIVALFILFIFIRRKNGRSYTVIFQ